MPRQVARAILPALEAPPSKTLRALLKSRPGSRPQREQPEISRDPLARALLPAIKDMHVLVGHVHALLNGSVAEEAGVIDWLKRLQAELDLAHEAVMSGRMSSRGVITTEDEEPAGLDDALSQAWDSENNDWPDQPEFRRPCSPRRQAPLLVPQARAATAWQSDGRKKAREVGY